MRIHPIAIAALVLSLNTASAFATPLTGSYSVGETFSSSQGGPTISNNLSSSFAMNLTLGIETTPTGFFTTAPASSCSGGGCIGGSSGTETDALTVTFNNLQILGVTIPTFTEMATFTAKYSGSELSCAVGDGVSPLNGQTDCFVWAGAANTWNGSTMLSKQLGNGYTLEIFLYNATDWNITPKIGFELVAAPTSVPEPATLGLIGAGLLGLGMLRRSRNAAR